MAIDFGKRPRRDLLLTHDAFVSSDPPFRSWCRFKQSVFRQEMGWACGTDGRIDPATGKPRRLGNYLTDADAKAGHNFLSEDIAFAAMHRLSNSEEGNNIEPGRLLGNMLTSQTMCFNLFLPQILNLKLASAIWSAVYREEVARVVDVKVEHSPGRRHAHTGIGDKSAFDAMVVFERPDRSLDILAIETKYTDSFSPGPTSDKRYSSIRGTNKTDVERARDHLIETEAMSSDGWSRALAMKTQQLWRTHALAASMKRAGFCRDAIYLVLHASGDQECVEILPAYAACLSEPARDRQIFRQLTLEKLVSVARDVLDEKDRLWIDRFEHRYLDWTAVERLTFANP